MDNLKKHIENQIQNSYFHLLEENINSDNPDYEWIVKLFSEIVDKMVVFLKFNSPLRIRIKENLDVELFSQMIKNKAFNTNDLINIINNTYDTLILLGAPIRDKDIIDTRDSLIQVLKNPNSTIGEVICLYVKKTHGCIDVYHNDFENAIKNDEKLEYIKNL